MFQSFKSASLNLIKQADQFGALFRPTIKMKNQYYKTIQGGIISIIIYGLSLAYFIYGIHQWTSNQILPTIVEQKVVKEVIAHQQSEQLISNECLFLGVIDPFDKQNLIFMVQGQDLRNYLFPTSEAFRVQQTDGKFYISNISLITNMSDQNNQTIQNVGIYIIPCDKELLQEDEQCASQDLLEQFWQQSNFLKLTQYFQQYDTNSKSIKELSRKIYIQLFQDKTIYNDYYLQQTIININQGILFPDYISQQFQTVIFEGSHIYLTFGMDSLSAYQNIAFANISSVLANIGSIVSSSLFFSFIAILINKKRLEDEAIFDVIKMYYPEFNNIIINKTWIGSINSIKNKQTNLFYDVYEYKQYYERLAYVAEQKLCMSNVIYELSRLQFAIQQLIPKEDLIKLREKHFEIKIQPQNIQQRDFKEPNFCQIVKINLQKQVTIDDQDLRTQKKVLKDEEQIKSPSYRQIQPSGDRVEGVQQIAIDDAQQRYDTNNEFELLENDFDIFCLNRYRNVKK